MATVTVGKLVRERSALKCQSFSYSFAKNAGAIGIYSTGITIPNKAGIFATFIHVSTLAVGLGATISLGWATNLIGIVNASAIPPPSYSPLLPAGLLSPGTEVFFSINTAPLTAGAFQIDIFYVEYFRP